MSSYLNIYGILKDSKKKVHLLSYSRNSDIYQAINDNLNITFVGVEEPKYTTLKSEKLDYVIREINSDIQQQENRIKEYDKYAGGNMEIIDTIISLRDYINDQINARNTISFIKDLIEETKYSWSGFSEICANVG